MDFTDWNSWLAAYVGNVDISFMNRRNFFGLLSAVAPLAVAPYPSTPPKRVKRLQSPKAAAEGGYTKTVRLASPGPASTQIQVVPGQFGISAITKTGSSVTVAWEGGTGPFQVQHRASFSGAWVNIGPRTTLRSVTIADALGFDTFRVQGYVGGASASLNPDNTVHLEWTAPEV